MINVALVMHSARSDNLGVGALAVSEVEMIRAIARRNGIDVHITLLDWKDPRAPYVRGGDVTIVEMTGRDLRSPGGFWRQVRRSDLVVDIGAGDSFADIYGPRRLRNMFIMKFLTHLARRPLIVAPQTIGPFTRPLSRALARLSLRLSKVVASRDEKRRRHCANWVSRHRGRAWSRRRTSPCAFPTRSPRRAPQAAGRASG